MGVDHYLRRRDDEENEIVLKEGSRAENEKEMEH
jgi:hypothetical protein